MSSPLRRLAPFLALAGACVLVYSLYKVGRALVPVVTALCEQGGADPAFTGRAVGELVVIAVVHGGMALPALLLVVFALVKAR